MHHMNNMFSICRRRSPITCRTGLQLANPLSISGNPILESVEQSRRRYCISFRDQDGLEDTRDWEWVTGGAS